jgi:hypothetical protein
LKQIFSTLSTSDSSILIHCISGWDRTPLFISLIRCILWADGLAHQSLNEEEFLYLTLSYDWLLFSHQLHNRLQKQEEIMYFCFYFLQHVEEDVRLVPGKKVQHTTSPLSEYKVYINEHYFSGGDESKSNIRQCDASLNLPESAEMYHVCGLEQEDSKRSSSNSSNGFVHVASKTSPAPNDDVVLILNPKSRRKERLLNLWTIFEKLYRKIIDESDFTTVYASKDDENLSNTVL